MAGVDEEHVDVDPYDPSCLAGEDVEQVYTGLHSPSDSAGVGVDARMVEKQAELALACRIFFLLPS